MQDSEHPLQGLVDRLDRRLPLGDEDRRAILALAYSTKVLDPASYIVREGDPPTDCAVLVSGFAFRQKQTRDGGRQIVSLHIPGEALDLQNLYLEVSDHSVQMLTRGEVALIRRPDMRALAFDRPAVGEAILVSMLVEASIFREWVLNVGRRDARSRIAHLLCEFAARMEASGLEKGPGHEVPMTQEQLADATGLTPVHVNRVLKGLEREGLIARCKRLITFPDRERLREAADFNQRYLHLDRQLVEAEAFA